MQEEIDGCSAPDELVAWGSEPEHYVPVRAAPTAAVAEGEAMIRLIVKLVVIDLALLVQCGAVILFGTSAVSYVFNLG
jgi:hypothetical protein